jgi:4-hydroxybenzoate polyprenyltransferase
VSSLAVDLIKIIRPWFIAVPVGPLLAARILADPAAGVLDAVLDPSTCWSVVIFGLTWTAVTTINDAYDGRTDPHNPRHSRVWAIARRLDKGKLLRLAAVTAVLDLVLSMVLLGGLFTLGTVVVLVTGWLYSAPPIRLKGRPGWDVAANAVPTGTCAPLAGWVLAGQPGTPPWQLALLCTVTIAALYIPTTEIDRVADGAAGIRTTAVALGSRATYWTGVAVWVVAATLYLVFLVGQTFGPFTVPWYAWLAWLPILLGYPLLMRRPSIVRLAALSGYMALHCGLIWLLNQ